MVSFSFDSSHEIYPFEFYGLLSNLSPVSRPPVRTISLDDPSAPNLSPTIARMTSRPATSSTSISISIKVDSSVQASPLLVFQPASTTPPAVNPTDPGPLAVGHSNSRLLTSVDQPLILPLLDLQLLFHKGLQPLTLSSSLHPESDPNLSSSNAFGL